MMYGLLRSALFSLPEETSHKIALDGMDVARQLGLSGMLGGARQDRQSPVQVMGLAFPNALGLAAGLDKNADHIDGLAALGFGFIEVGTLTPRPQPGNPKPRLFRLPEHEAIINRMGFNNKGIDHALAQIKKSHFRGVLGINIGKNADTPVEKAADDYLIGLKKAWPLASYIVVNLSSPNTPGLRTLQYGDDLRALLATLKAEHARLAEADGRYVPLVVKIAPDMTLEELGTVADALTEYEIDAVAATNTTLSREAVAGHRHGDQAGGLSGKPLTVAATDVIWHLHQRLGDSIPIIGVGGISSLADAEAKLAAGASLLQIYSGFIYRGPALVREIVEGLYSHEQKSSHEQVNSPEQENQR